MVTAYNAICFFAPYCFWKNFSYDAGDIARSRVVRDVVLIIIVGLLFVLAIKFILFDDVSHSWQHGLDAINCEISFYYTDENGFMFPDWKAVSINEEYTKRLFWHLYTITVLTSLIVYSAGRDKYKERLLEYRLMQSRREE